MPTFLSACPAEPDPTPTPEVHRPTTVGVIVERENLGNRMGRLTLESGDTVTVHLDHDRRNGVDPQVGDVLLAGEDSDPPWFYALPGSVECFRLSDHEASDLGQSIRFSFGLELPKAEGYDSGYLGPALSVPRGVRFCVNQHGEITSASL